jgi:hypothetical protein
LSVAAVSLTASIGPPGSAREMASPATNGARLSRAHSSSVKSALDVIEHLLFAAGAGRYIVSPVETPSRIC